ncbi:MAG: DUF6892 domain-containing protein [Microbacteriaceae bacterium]
MVNTIDFSADGITVDGTLIGFPLTTAKTREVFGEPRLSTGKDHAVQTWDHLGLKTFGPLDGTLVAILDVFPEGRDDDNYSYNPTGGFPGTITIDGVHVDAVQFDPGFAADKLYRELGPFIVSRALDRPGGGFYDFFIRRADADYFSRPEGVEAAEQHLATRWTQPEQPIHSVDFSAAGVTIDGTLVALPAAPAVFEKLLGTAREQVVSTTGGRSTDAAADLFWDAFGLRASGPTGVVAAFAVVDGVGDSRAPLSPASGIRLTVNGAHPAETSWGSSAAFERSVRLGENVLSRVAQPQQLFWQLATTQAVRPVERASQSLKFPAKLPAPTVLPVAGAVSAAVAAAVASPLSTLRSVAKGDYTIKNLVEPVLVFTDFGVKLQIIEELMFKQNKLKPRFDLEDFTNWLPDRVVDLAAEGGAPIPEARVYFENLPIPARFAYDVKALTISPSSTVFTQMQPLGTPEPVEISSLDDLAQFPYVKKVTLEMSQDTAGIDTLESRGVTVHIVQPEH